MTLFREKIFPAAAGALWLVFLLLDLTRLGDSTWVKFAAICLCAAAALTGAKSRDGRLVALALGFTVGADVFLLLLDRDGGDQVIGVCLFLVVQLLYAYRLYCLGGKTSRWFFPRLALSCLLAGLTLFPLWCAGVYFLNLCCNTVQAWLLKRKRPGEKPLSRFAWGLLLFVGCDVCVGLWNVSALLPTALAEFSRVGMWLFYLPSQALIVLSQRLEGDNV